MLSLVLAEPSPAGPVVDVYVCIYGECVHVVVVQQLRNDDASSISLLCVSKHNNSLRMPLCCFGGGGEATISGR